MGKAVAKKRELFRNGFREEIGLSMTDTGHKEWLWPKKNGGPAMERTIGE